MPKKKKPSNGGLLQSTLRKMQSRTQKAGGTALKAKPKKKKKKPTKKNTNKAGVGASLQAKAKAKARAARRKKLGLK